MLTIRMLEDMKGDKSEVLYHIKTAKRNGFENQGHKIRRYLQVTIVNFLMQQDLEKKKKS